MLYRAELRSFAESGRIRPHTWSLAGASSTWLGKGEGTRYAASGTFHRYCSSSRHCHMGVPRYLTAICGSVGPVSVDLPNPFAKLCIKMQIQNQQDNVARRVYWTAVTHGTCAYSTTKWACKRCFPLSYYRTVCVICHIDGVGHLLCPKKMHVVCQY